MQTFYNVYAVSKKLFTTTFHSSALGCFLLLLVNCFTGVTGNAQLTPVKSKEHFTDYSRGVNSFVTEACALNCPAAPIVVSNDPNQCGAVINSFAGLTSTGTDCGAIITTPAAGSFFNLGNTAVTATVVTKLYEQTGTSTNGAPSQNFEPALDAFDAESADDFTVPVGETWRIKQVRVGGTGTGVPTSISVKFYSNTGSLPGATVVANFPNLTSFSGGPNYLITLPSDAVLPGGATYWVSVIVNMNFGTGGQWFWSNFGNTNIGSEYAFRNPGGGFATPCTNFGPGSTGCGVGGGVARNLIFSLIGTTNVGPTNCAFTVRVNDTQAPAITCPANITVTTTAGLCTAVANYTTPTATDNCPGVPTVTRTAGPASGSAFPVGVTTVTHQATDAAGNVSANCTFTVTVLDGQLPVITTPPANRTVCAGTTATFSVTATNAVTYQWQEFLAGMWTNVTGATASSFSVTNPTQSMNTRTFRVNVTGLCTTVPSAAATLFVNPLPTISLTSSNPAVLLPGQTTSIVANVNPTGGTFAWFKNGVARLPTVTTGTLSNLTVDDAGTYYAVYTDLNGCVATSANIVISAEASDLFFVAPNPNFGQFWVRYYNQLNEPLTVIVYDSKGARVHQQTSATTLPYTQINVDMRVKSGGIYLVELRGADGRRLGAKQIIVGPR